MAIHQDVSGCNEVPLPDIPNNTNVRIAFISTERLGVIQPLALMSRNGPTSKSAQPRLYMRLDKFLRWLDEVLQMTPEIKQKTKIDLGLKLMFDSKEYYFLPQYVDKARELYGRWEDVNWGASEAEGEAMDIDEDHHDEVKVEPGRKRHKTSTASKARKDSAVRTNEDSDDAGPAVLRLPPANHPVWGVDGTMHGICLSEGKRRTQKLDPRYIQSKRDFRAYGHNGCQVGDWYPFQIVALFRGAHGASQGGISGNKNTGAYSIVVSSQYDDLDHDRGDSLYYSGSDSHKPKRPSPASTGTLALHMSIATGNPVRVLRSHTGKTRFAPSEGLRYDGLYEVLEVRERVNNNGGKYEQFRLTRMAGQSEIATHRPNATEVRELERIERGFKAI